jgi:hypothetical protein
MKHNQIYYGVVESRDADPKKLGRCKVRVVGIHTEDSVLLPTKDLPWAYPLMPVHSASMSGIGYSPTGIVEGTWCAITFRDEYMQQPVIMGTVGGIPEDDAILPSTPTITYTVATQATLKDSSGNDVVDGSGNPVVTGPVVTETVTEAAMPLTTIKKASSLVTSPAGLEFIKKRESIIVGKANTQSGAPIVFPPSAATTSTGLPPGYTDNGDGTASSAFQPGINGRATLLTWTPGNSGIGEVVKSTVNGKTVYTVNGNDITQGSTIDPEIAAERERQWQSEHGANWVDVVPPNPWVPTSTN